MKNTENKNCKEVVKNLKNFSAPELTLIRNEINNLLNEDEDFHKAEVKLTEEEILNAPIMSDEEYERIKEVRKDLSKWKIPTSS